MSGIPKTTLRSDDFLEGLPELRKAGIVTVNVCYVKRYRLNQQRGKPAQAEPRHWLSVIPPSGIMETTLNSPGSDV